MGRRTAGSAVVFRPADVGVTLPPMGLQYVASSRLRDMVLELVRMAAPSCIGLDLETFPGPFRPQNWRIGKLQVLAPDYGAARDKADALQALRQWILVPDGHVLDGQVFGREEAR